MIHYVVTYDLRQRKVIACGRAFAEVAASPLGQLTRNRPAVTCPDCLEALGRPTVSTPWDDLREVLIDRLVEPFSVRLTALVARLRR